MILTAAESSWDRNEYKRTWRDGQYLDKFSWKGHLRGMQLFSRKSDILQAEVGFQDPKAHRKKYFRRFGYQTTK